MTKISNKAVTARTGRGWSDWFAELDAAGCSSRSHREIVRMISDNNSHIGDWWCQMVAVEYERARGLRKLNEKPSGFEISKTRTIAASPGAVYNAWLFDAQRATWLADPGVSIRKASKNKSLRLTWVDGQSVVDVDLYRKGENKTQVVVQHRKLDGETAASDKKTYWAEQLSRLKLMLEDAARC